MTVVRIELFYGQSSRQYEYFNPQIAATPLRLVAADMSLPLRRFLHPHRKQQGSFSFAR